MFYDSYFKPIKESNLPKITPSTKKKQAVKVSTSFQAVPMNIPTQIHQLQTVPMVTTSTPTQFVINTQPMVTTLPMANMPTNQLTTLLQNAIPNNSGPVIVKLLDNANFNGQNFITVPTQNGTPTQNLVIPNMTIPTKTDKVEEKKDEVIAEVKTELEIEEIIEDPCHKPNLKATPTQPPTLSKPTQPNGNEEMVIKDEIEDEFYIGGADKSKSRDEESSTIISKDYFGGLSIYRCEFCKRKFDCPRGLKVHIGYCKNFDKFKKSSASGEPLAINLTDKFVPFYPNSNSGRFSFLTCIFAWVLIYYIAWVGIETVKSLFKY